jgi:hypothetical protein
MLAYESYDPQIEWLNLCSLYFIILHLFVPLLVHFQTKNPLLCIKVKNCLVNENKCITWKILKNVWNQGMMKNARPSINTHAISVIQFCEGVLDNFTHVYIFSFVFAKIKMVDV